MIPHGFIQELLSRVDIVDVVGRHVELKKAGINHKGLCPFHGEKSPSFIVSPSRQTYHCFGCGVHGTALTFLMEHDRLAFPDAVADLAGRLGMEVPREGGTTDEGRAFFVPYEEIAYVRLERVVRVGELKRMYGEAGYVDAGRGFGLSEMAKAISEHRPHRVSGELGFHILEVMESILSSGRSDRRIPIKSTVASIDLVPLSKEI